MTNNPSEFQGVEVLTQSGNSLGPRIVKPDAAPLKDGGAINSSLVTSAAKEGVECGPGYAEYQASCSFDVVYSASQLEFLKNFCR